MLRPRVVILGAGFGGVYVAKRLAPFAKKEKLDITIVNRTNHFLFTPLLHEVATGSLSPDSVVQPLREIFCGRGVEFCQGEIESVDVAGRRVNVRSTAAGSSKHVIDFDYLVITTGAETAYYDTPGARQFSFPLKTLSDAVRIRNAVIDAFEGAMSSRDQEERSRLLSFAVVGGGPTGVETAAELAEFIRGMTKRQCHASGPGPGGMSVRLREEPTIGIVDLSDELIKQFSPSVRSAAAERLKKLGVNLHLGNKVTAVTPKGLTLSNDTTVPASTVIWAAGVKPVIPEFADFTPVLANGRLTVDEYFRVNGDDRIFALGDIAAHLSSAGRGDIDPARPVPMLAQAAVQEAKIVARNIIAAVDGKKLHTFRYRPKGSLVSVGGWFAVGEILSLRISGRFAWWIWRTVYLFKFASWRKRLRIAFEWTLDLFYPRDTARIS